MKKRPTGVVSYLSFMGKIIKFVMEKHASCFVGIVYVIILAMCMFMCYETATYEPRMPLTSDYKVSLIVSDKDTLLNERYKKELDSLKLLLLKHPKQQYAEGINDVRQETNNIINKINGWLSFWLAIVALIGGVIPILISWKQEKTYDTRFERLKQQQNNDNSILRQKVYLEISELKTEKAKNEEILEKYYKDFIDLQNHLQIYKSQMNITNIVSSFIAAQDNKLLQESLGRDLLRTSLLNELSLEFENIINQTFPNHYTHVNKMVLTTVLLQFHGLFVRFRPVLVRRNKTKQLENILLTLKNTIDVVTVDRLSTIGIESKIKDVRNEIKKSNSLFYDNM